jgi:hypothetical protein
LPQADVGEAPGASGATQGASSPTCEELLAALLLGEITVKVDPVTGQVIALDPSDPGGRND